MELSSNNMNLIMSENRDKYCLDKRAADTIWIERFWKTIKYEYIYIQPEENGADLFFGIKRFIDDYNYHRRHQGINRTVPSKLYIRQVAWS